MVALVDDDEAVAGERQAGIVPSSQRLQHGHVDDRMLPLARSDIPLRRGCAGQRHQRGRSPSRARHLDGRTLAELATC